MGRPLATAERPFAAQLTRRLPRAEPVSDRCPRSPEDSYSTHAEMAVPLRDGRGCLKATLSSADECHPLASPCVNPLVTTYLYGTMAWGSKKSKHSYDETKRVRRKACQ